MTQKEFVLRKEPGAENKDCFGGMSYCPHAYRDILPIPLDLCNANTASAELCEKSFSAT